MDTNNRLRAIWHGLTSCGRNNEFVEPSDLNTFDRRLVSEGAEFYARSLTGLRSCFLAGLETGQLDISATRFKTRAGSQLPAFLHLAFSSVFNKDGSLRDVVNVHAVSCLNQLLAVFGKIEGGHPKDSERKCLESFVKNEEKVRAWSTFLATHYGSSLRAHSSALPSPIDRYKFRMIKDKDYLMHNARTAADDNRANHPEPDQELIRDNHLDLVIMEARRLVLRVLSSEDPRELHPKHGSGASACSTPVRWRYGTPRYIESIDRIWSYSEYFYASTNHLIDDLGGRIDVQGESAKQLWLDHLTEYTPCAKVLLVPKDARGLRLISCEPRETMWIQQGLLPKLVTCMEAHPLTKGLVNFTDQSINRYQAFRGSITRESSTLDLKDASDLISLGLVECLFPANWFASLTACRSGSTRLPDGTVVELSKHAPMGSALCFPVMALTIWSLLTAYANMAQTERSVRVSGALAKRNKSFAWENPVYVYGDDIILPSSFAEGAKLVLASVGLIVNTNKSFVHGSFKESCGGEYYDGWDVTPVRLRALPDDDIPSRMRLIAFHNNIVKRYKEQPRWLTDYIHQWYTNVPERSVNVARDEVNGLGAHHPRILAPDIALNAMQLVDISSSLSAVLDVHSADNQHLPRRFRRDYHRVEYRFLSVVPKGVKYPKDSWSQVLRALVNPRVEQEFGWDALAKRVSYKYRWAVLR